MGSFEIVVDSCADFEQDALSKNEIKMIPFNVSKNGIDFCRDWLDMKPSDFVTSIINNPDLRPKTATPSPELYINAFEEILGRGKDVLCVCATQTLTSVMRTAEAAKESILERLPHAKIEVIDSELLTAGQADFVMQAVNLRDNNFSIDDALGKLYKIRELARIYFFVQGTKYLHLGGRIGKVGAVATELLSIKPLIVLKSGEISPFGVTRSRKNGLNKIVAAAKDYFHKENVKPDDLTVCIATSPDVQSEFARLKELLKHELGIKEITQAYTVGATVVAHTGPGVVGFTLLRKPESI